MGELGNGQKRLSKLPRKRARGDVSDGEQKRLVPVRHDRFDDVSDKAERHAERLLCLPSGPDHCALAFLHRLGLDRDRGSALER